MHYHHCCSQVITTALEAKSQNLLQHSLRVAELSVEISSHLRCTIQHRAEEVYTAGLIHDVGKLYISDSILNKDESLTEREWEAIRAHSLWGFKFLKSIDRMGSYASIPLLHHEKPDGTGYPKGLTLDEIPVLVRVINIADRFSAVTESRPYRRAMPKETAIEQVREDVKTFFTHEAGKVIDSLALFDWREGITTNKRSK